MSLVPVSRETESRFAIYADLLARWQAVTDLVSPQTLGCVWTRHIADSAQLVDLLPSPKRWIDLGSGAGFPGLVIAIRLATVEGALVHCIESDRRKCAFLREVVRATGAPAQIHAQRIEDVDAGEMGGIDAVTARALAPLPLTLRFAKFWLDQGAVGLFPRGKSAKRELRSLGPVTGFRTELIPSVVDAEAAIVSISRSQGDADGPTRSASGRA